ncbi:MAG: hypothetical protein LBV17_08795 [Treponema sp.]|jgi:hypothetical protein|nr:hypothetical protein [Treponema sp.]
MKIIKGVFLGDKMTLSSKTIPSLIIDKVSSSINVEHSTAITIIEKALAGGEITDFSSSDHWLNERFIPNCVFIDEDGYAKMCINALKILDKTAATYYGSSRQRDMGQLWADMTRGYLGEYAFKLFLMQKYNIDTELGHERGNLSDYLPTDIHKIKRNGENWVSPKLNISIKTTKWNGIWFDIPGDQFNHSDIHVFIKIGVGRNHLFAFFKKLSIFKDKILMKGKEIGLLSEQEAVNLYDNLPSFSPVPAYICGFIEKSAQFKPLSYGGKCGKKNFTIKSWNGQICPGDLEKIKQREYISGSVKFEGIGKFAHDSGYLFNTGNLKYSPKDWASVIERL